jgi:hypothetical protein
METTLTPSQFAAKAQPYLGIPGFFGLGGPTVAAQPANGDFNNPGAQLPAANQGGGAVLTAAAQTVNAAGSGVRSGVQWAVIIVLLGLFGYLLALASPFIPKPRGA